MAVTGARGPVLDWPFAERWQASIRWRRGRVAPGVPTWLVALVVALFADGPDGSDAPVPQSVRCFVVLATPFLLMARPKLGCVTAVVAAVLLWTAAEPLQVVVPFTVHAVLCLYLLVRFLAGPRRQRRLVAGFASPASVELPDGDAVSRRAPGGRASVTTGLVVLAAAFAVWAWLGDEPALLFWTAAVGLAALLRTARLTAARWAAHRLVSRPAPAIRALVRIGPAATLTLCTDDVHRLPVASVPLSEVVHRVADAEEADVRTVTATVHGEEPPDAFFPATVVGDFRVGGYVAVVTGHCVLLPRGPLRALHEEPAVEITGRLADGRRWSGLTPPG